MLSLYQGLGTKNLQSFISQFAYFYGYSFFKRTYLEKSGKKTIGTTANLIIAAAAGACTVVVTQVWLHLMCSLCNGNRTSIILLPRYWFDSVVFYWNNLNQSLCYVHDRCLLVSYFYYHHVFTGILIISLKMETEFCHLRLIKSTKTEKKHDKNESKVVSSCYFFKFIDTSKVDCFQCCE